MPIPNPQSPIPETAFDEQQAIDLVMQMVAIPGRSGDEVHVAEFIRRELLRAGIPRAAIGTDNAHRRGKAGGSMGNIILKLPGTQRAPRRLLMAHIDTVPLCVGCQPVRAGDWIRSRNPETALGGDNRAGASVILQAVCEVVRRRLPHPPLTLLWTVQEEVGLFGARYVSLTKLGQPKLCFNWDGGPPNLAVIGATGDYHIEIAIKGIASHAGAHPEQGVSAIASASLAIARLVEQGWHGLIVKGKNSGTSNVGVIHGGEATNVVTPHVQVRAEARSHDPRFRRRIVAEIQTAFQDAVARVKSDVGKTGQLAFRADLKYESFRLAPDERCVCAALRAIDAAGLSPERHISNGGLDANWMTAHGLPTVTLGCGQQDIHTAQESLHVPSYLHACRIALLLATGSEEVDP